MTADLSDEELNHINQRLERVLTRFDSMPYHALLYRLGEVASNRIDERKLRRALAELSNNRRPRRGRVPRPGPWESCPRIYVSAEAGRDEAAQMAHTAVTQLHELAAYCGAGVIARLADMLKVTLRASESHAGLPTVPSIVLGGSVKQDAETRQLHVRKRRARSAVHVLVLHEAGWLYPDDRRLWRFLINAQRNDARTVVVARAIAPGTFPLLKALGAIGTQYYATLIPDEYTPQAELLRDALGWSHVLKVGSITTHPVIDRIKKAIERLSREENASAVRRALEHAATIDLDSAPSIENLLRWWHTSGLPLPTPVARGWLRWIAWSRYRRRGRSIHHNGGTALEAIESELAFDARTEHGVSADDLTPSRGFGRDTQVIPLGLPLSRREVEEILASTRRSYRKRPLG